MYIDDQARLQHMLDAAREVIEFVSVHDRSELDSDPFLARGLVKTLEIIGEASSKITRNFRDSNPQITWRDLVDMRNHLTHDYYSFNLNTVWQIASADIPQLVAELEKLTPAK